MEYRSSEEWRDSCRQKFAELEENRGIGIFIGADKMDIVRETRKQEATDRGIDRFSV